MRSAARGGRAVGGAVGRAVGRLGGRLASAASSARGEARGEPRRREEAGTGVRSPPHREMVLWEGGGEPVCPGMRGEGRDLRFQRGKQRVGRFLPQLPAEAAAGTRCCSEAVCFASPQYRSAAEARLRRSGMSGRTWATCGFVLAAGESSPSMCCETRCVVKQAVSENCLMEITADTEIE